MSFVARFGLWAALLRALSPDDVGRYGLVTASAQLGIVILGLEYYNATTRMLPVASTAVRAALLREQMLLHGATYALVTTATLVAAAAGFPALPFAPLVIGLFVLEHFSHELSRLLIAVGHPLAANVAVFLRTGLWPLLITVWVVGAGQAVTLSAVLITWATAGLVAAAFSFVLLRHSFQAPEKPVELQLRRVYAGLQSAVPFALSAACVVLANQAPRYFLGLSGQLAAAGTFAFLSATVLSLEGLVQAAFVSHHLPDLLRSEAHRSADGGNVRQRMTRGIVLTTSIGTALLIPAIMVIARFTERSDITANPAVPALLLMGGFLSTGSLPWHYRLYSAHRDRTILQIHAIWFLSAIAGYWLLVPMFGLLGAALAYALSTVALTAGRLTAARVYDG